MYGCQGDMVRQGNCERAGFLRFRTSVQRGRRFQLRLPQTFCESVISPCFFSAICPTFAGEKPAVSVTMSLKNDTGRRAGNPDARVEGEIKGRGDLLA